MKAIVFKGRNRVICEEVPSPKVPSGWALIKVTHAGVCGTDLSIYGGTHPRAKPPLVIGHEFSGEMAEDAPGLPRGTRVTVYPLLSCRQCGPCKNGDIHACDRLQLLGVDCDGAMAEYAVAPIDQIYRLPDNVSGKLGAFVEPVAVTVHALREAEFRPGDQAMVFGCGAIGLSTALTLRNFGAREVVLAETDPVRAQNARDLGFPVYDPAQLDIVAAAKAHTGGEGFDWVFDCAGVQPVADVLFDVARTKGTIVIVAAYKQPAALPLVVALCRELTIKSVHVYRPKDFQIAIELVAKDPDYEKVITHVLAPERVQEGFDLLLQKGTGAEKVLFQF